jgi:DNA-binding GntR family transcriptional regulator
VSRGPLREAFRMLEEAGLVRTEKNRGVFVRDIPIDEAVEIFDLRAAMDELVGRRLAEAHHAGAAEGDASGLVDAMERSVKAQDTRAYHLLNLQFHDRLVEMAGNSKLCTIYRKLIKELSLFRRLNLADGWLMPISRRRAPRHRQGHRQRRRAGRRPRHVRPCHGEQGTNDRQRFTAPGARSSRNCRPPKGKNLPC